MSKTNKLREEIISIFESAGLQEDETSMQMLDMIMGVFDQALAQKEAEARESEREKIHMMIVPILGRHKYISLKDKFYEDQFGWALRSMERYAN